ncbi:transglutaminase domain-containing protein [Neobittarella massiliensis]|uniref:transglutaminase domain-containing protein n=1 Tax=Neobittarella massiliensis (ex Bilen et al. 2018) TaxID=2041842 RepID=UPI000CF661C9|nr:transglutaminase domain-containing protein [Neobittarella massiliensis]
MQKKSHRRYRHLFVSLLALLLLTALTGCQLGDKVEGLLGPEADLIVAGEDIDAKLEAKYGRTQLSGDEQILYDALYTAVASRQDEVRIKGDITAEELERVYRYYFSDSPEHFWIEGYRYVTRTESGRVKKVLLDYSGTRGEIEAQSSQLQQKLEELDSQMQGQPGDFERSVFVSDYLSATLQYDTEQAAGADAYTAYGALVQGQAVCQGYAKAAQLLFQQAGMECLYVRGESRGERHGWNIVKLEGAYYHLDPTWNDIQFESSEQEQGVRNHTYQNITTADILRDHQIDDSENYPLPDCSEQALNYYVKNGLQAADFEQIADRAAEVAAQNIAAGEDYLELRFGSKEQALELVESRNAMGRLLGDINYRLNDVQLSYAYSYYLNEEQSTVQIYFQRAES